MQLCHPPEGRGEERRAGEEGGVEAQASASPVVRMSNYGNYITVGLKRHCLLAVTGGKVFKQTIVL